MTPPRKGKDADGYELSLNVCIVNIGPRIGSLSDKLQPVGHLARLPITLLIEKWSVLCM